MREYVVLSWNLHGKGGAKAALRLLQRCDLRHLARQSVESVVDDPHSEEPWDTGSYGSVRLLADDPRIALLRSELGAMGEVPSERVERVFTDAERAGADWLVVLNCNSAVAAGRHEGQQWSFRTACRSCGGGAVPVPPLIARLGRMPRGGWVVSAPHELAIVSRAVGERLACASLTGFVLEPVTRSARGAPDPRYLWMRVTAQWTARHLANGARTDACAACGRIAFEPGGEHRIRFTKPEAPRADFAFCQSSRASSGIRNPATGGFSVIIISQRAYRVLKEAGVKNLRVEPVRVSG
jgi:hypothetical protein